MACTAIPVIRPYGQTDDIPVETFSDDQLEQVSATENTTAPTVVESAPGTAIPITSRYSGAPVYSPHFTGLDDADATPDSPNWLASQIAAITASGVIRRHPPRRGT